MSAPATSPDDRVRRLQRLLEAGRSLTAELDLDLLLTRILETARELTGARYAALGVLDEVRRALAQFHAVGDTPDMHAVIGHLPTGRGVLGLLIDDPEPIRVRDVAEHPRSFGFPPGHPPMRGFLGAPVLIRGEAWGNLYLTEKTGEEDFDDEDVEAIVVLAEWAAIAIDNARLFGTSEQRRVELERAVAATEAGVDIALAVGGETELPAILELIAARARALVDASTLLIWLVDEDELRLATSVGEAEPPPGAAVPIAGSTAGLSLRTAAPQRVDDVRSGLRIDPAAFGIENARSALIVPLVFRGRGLGVVSAFDRVGDSARFSADDERMLRSFAASAATAVATARTVERHRLRDTLAAAEAERRRWARDLHDGTLQGLSALKLMIGAMRRADGDARERFAAQALAQVEHEIAGLREVISDLRPSALDELGLQAALRTLTEGFAVRHALACDLALDLGDRRLAPEIETLAYRVVQEALTNVGKHADAHAVRVAVELPARRLVVTVEDDGRGLDAAARPSGYGLLGMRERAELAGGTVVVAPRPGGGTRVRLSVPVG